MRDNLKSRRDKIEVEITKIGELIKVCIKENNKPKATLLLKKRKIDEKTIADIDNRDILISEKMK